MNRTSLLVILATLSAPVVIAQDDLVPGYHVPPEVGSVAKPIETVYWYYKGARGSVPAIADLRGQVVLVHTWGYYCGPCMREGVPYVVDLMRAHREEGLRTFSISTQVSDGQPDDHFVTVGREQGIEHPMGLATMDGSMTPYLNMNVNKGLTWCFVIGREGGVRWAGDPSIDDEDFLAAVRQALDEEPMPSLAQGMPQALDKAVASYIAGELARASALAAKVHKKFSSGKAKPERTAVAEQAAALVQKIDTYRDELVKRLQTAFEGRDAEGYLCARQYLLARFAKTDAAKQVKDFDRQVKGDDAFEQDLERWTEWHELRGDAPTLFPVRVDRDAKRYAKRLRKYVEEAQPDAPGMVRARAMLSVFDKQ